MYQCGILCAGAELSGPVIIDSASTMVLLHPGDSTQVYELGCLHLFRRVSTHDEATGHQPAYAFAFHSIVRHKLQAIAEEVAETMTHTCFPLSSTTRLGLFDDYRRRRRQHTIAKAERVPIHMGAILALLTHFPHQLSSETAEYRQRASAGTGVGYLR
ncbi:hypothetical protein [Sodalis-like endosymbiont of Proechinophthirus fluctus]|uniref:hypothetical protein n=1 Tax=Sodalis-like endosymbiont of Proechinophthirus fluctus TaxID=1462730 RepID=UPI00164F7A2E|nr:hypothetical protein [Sodalis-like endosymbiont of Proechinophthirus fluctus]